MILNIKRFAPDPYWFEVNVQTEYQYTTKNYTASCLVILMGEYDFSSIVDQNGRDVTSEWHVNGNMGSKRITQETHDVLTIYSENGYYSDNIAIDVSDFTPDSDLYAPEINGDVRVRNTELKLKDIVNIVQTVTDIIYPIGSVYISTTTTNPGNLFGGTWEKIATGRTLWGASNDSELNTTVNSGLPNITGNMTYMQWNNSVGFYNFGTTGAFYNYQTNPSGRVSCEDTYWGSGSNSASLLGFNAQNSNSIYGASSIVQPPAYKVYMWRRIA